MIGFLLAILVLLGLLAAVARTKGASADWATFAFWMWFIGLCIGYGIGQFSP